jgi:hypothetical protein
MRRRRRTSRKRKRERRNALFSSDGLELDSIFGILSTTGWASLVEVGEDVMMAEPTDLQHEASKNADGGPSVSASRESRLVPKEPPDAERKI